MRFSRNVTITIWYPPKDLPNSMLLETLLATFAPIVHEADLWRGNLPCIIRIIFESFLIQESALNHPNDFGIIFDSGPARIIRIILESFLIRARIQDPRFLGGLCKESWIQYLPESSESFWPGSKIQYPRCLGGLLKESWIPYLPESSESFWNHF